MKSYKNILNALLAFGAIALVAVLLLVVYDQYKPQSTKGAKEIVVEVVILGEESQEFTIDTEAEYLGQALKEKDLVNGTEGDYGLFITEVNGLVANDSKQEWWCITKGSEYLYTGADETPIKDGEHYELTLTVGY